MEYTFPLLHRRDISFGADPELFIREKATQKIIPADKFLPSKNKKKKVESRDDGGYCGTMFFDGAQAELNPDSNTCREIFAANLYDCLYALKRSIGKEYELWISASERVDRKLLKEADLECRRFGCDPDINAYTGTTNKIRLDGNKHLIRYAGGHIHLGFTRSKFSDSELRDLIKTIDVITGIPATLLDIDPKSRRRRLYYGHAGDFRHQEHGIEYRTLSNFWLRSPQLTSLILGLVRSAFIIWDANEHSKIFSIESPDNIQKIINQTRIKEARSTFDKLKPYLVQVNGPLDCLSGLSFFEYTSRVGISSIFNRTCSRAWQLRYPEDFDMCEGWLSGMDNKLCGTKQFNKFEIEFNKKHKDLKFYTNY